MPEKTRLNRTTTGSWHQIAGFRLPTGVEFCEKFNLFEIISRDCNLLIIDELDSLTFAGEQMEELTLIKASQGGDKAAFGSLIDKYYKGIYCLAYSHTGRHEEADDICQETFLRAFKKIEQLKDGNCFKGWIFMIATNLLRKRIREIGSRRQMHQEQWNNTRFNGDEAIEPLERLSTKERAKIIHRQLQEMPEYMRLVTILILMEGLSQKDAAGVLNCSEASVCRHLAMARKWLRARLQHLV